MAFLFPALPVRHHARVAFNSASDTSFKRCNRWVCCATGYSRRSFLCISSAITVGVLLPSFAKNFNIPPACAALLSRDEAESEATAARDALGGLALSVAGKRYDEFRRALRAGAPSRIRAACHALASGGPPGAEEAYEKLIRSVEEVDLLALKASRGDKGAAEMVLTAYDQLVAQFDDFLDMIPGLTMKAPSFK